MTKLKTLRHSSNTKVGRCMSLLALGMAALAAPAAFGQSDLAAARDCANITADGARLACYDRVLRAEPGRTERLSESSSAASSRSNSEERRAESEGDEEEGVVSVTVVEVRRSGARNESVFITDDGTVWRQTDGRRVVVPPTPFTAEIRPGALGSSFLAPAGRGRAIRVTQR